MGCPGRIMLQNLHQFFQLAYQPTKIPFTKTKRIIFYRSTSNLILTLNESTSLCQPHKHIYTFITAFAHIVLWQAHKKGTPMNFYESLSFIQIQLIKYMLKVRILGSSKHSTAVFQNL